MGRRPAHRNGSHSFEVEITFLKPVVEEVRVRKQGVPDARDGDLVGLDASTVRREGVHRPRGSGQRPTLTHVRGVRI